MNVMDPRSSGPQAARPPVATPQACVAPASRPSPAQSESTSVALSLRGLTKRYGSTVAVLEVDLSVPQGAFFGLVGPNGAGKTTLLSMAVGLLEPDHGNAWVAGAPMWPVKCSGPAKAVLGVLPDGLALPARLTGRELLHYLGLLRGLPAQVVRARTDELVEVFDLAGAEHTLIGDYSTGMRKKLGLATALLHGPRLLMADEPFEAVDPVSAAVVRAILDGFLAAGGTVVLSSHVMALVEQLCDHVAVLDHGHVLRVGTLNEVRAGHSLDEAFATIVGAEAPARGLSWFTC